MELGMKRGFKKDRQQTNNLGRFRSNGLKCIVWLNLMDVINFEYIKLLNWIQNLESQKVGLNIKAGWLPQKKAKI